MQEVIKKLRFKGKGIVLNSPPSMENAFEKAGFATSLDTKAKSANTLVFINNKKELLQFLTNNLPHIEPDGVLWFAYPKGTSGIKTDINRDTMRVAAEEFGITTVAAISIDDTWSGLRFRPLDNVGS